MTENQTNVGDAFVELNLPPNVDLKVLIDYVSQRLGINILYDEQIANKKITIKAPTHIPVDSLLGLLESALRMKGLLLVEGDQPGWKHVVAIKDLTAVSATVTNEQADTSQNEVQSRIFALQYAQPTQIEAVIKPFLTQPGANTIGVAGQKLLIVTDFAANMPRIVKFVELMDRPPGEVSTRFVPAQHVSATVLAPQVSQLLTAQARVGGGDTTADLEVTADDRTNQLIVIGAPQRVEKALTIAASLDVPLGLTTQVYRFSAVSPERVDRLAKETIDPQQAKNLYRSTVDKDASLLVVTTTPEVHERIKSLQASLDVAQPETQSPIRIYKLTNASAADVLQTIEAIEGQRGFESVTLTDAPGSVAPGSVGEYVQEGRTPSTPPPSAPGTSGGTGIVRQPSPFEEVTDEPIEQADRPRALQTVQSSRATVTADLNTNSIIVIAEPAVQRVYERLIEMLDQRRPQVLIEVTIVTIDTSDDFSLGVELAREGTISLGGKQASSLFFSQFGLSTLDDSNHLVLEPGAGFNGVVMSTDIADVVIRALKGNSRATVVSTPKILVNDNASGTINSINEAPFSSINASNTVSTTSFGGFVSAGTQIMVTPHIAEGDHLRLEFQVSLNSFTGASGGGLPPPRQTNSIQSEVTIPDGSTIVVGGLNRMDSTYSKQAVPFIGAVPGLEYLFSSRTQGDRNATLFVFLRPVILRDDQFRDLKYISRRDVARADVTNQAPTSAPMVVR
ncbi:MAG: hypothetical protein IT445_06420 [Phycisphaeraceae bacterium]|nr:hypothetical protein [Phycisphaeraceae bacterium]